MRRGLRLMVVAAMLSAVVHGAEARGVVDRTKPAVRGITRASLDLADNEEPADGIAIRHVRLEEATPIDGTPTVLLKFDLHNEGWASVTDIVLSVSLRTAENGKPLEPLTRVRPFTIKIPNVLLAGYSFDYEIRLRNVSLDTASAPEIEVVEAQRVVDDVF
jgi:hypothetical protein